MPIPDMRLLRWLDVDPQLHAFDPAPARERVAARIRAAVGDDLSRKAAASGVDRNALESAINRDLLGEYGAWVSGWSWGGTEAGGGGPIRGWCCPRDSLLRKDDADAMASVERIVRALAEWRGFLEELAGVFADLHQSTGDLSIDEGVERAAARLLPMIVERTSAEDAWHRTFERVLGWYLESAGHDPEVFRGPVERVISGRFESWIAPDAERGRAACAELGRGVALATEEPTTLHDALGEWRRVRGQAFAARVKPKERDPVRADGHLRYLESFDRARDPGRADRMRAALGACRESARRGEDLTFERLAAWQATVLGAPAAFRKGDAYGKGGRERYAIDAKTERRFTADLLEANDPATPIPVRAARAYLDVCFYHPFGDGNARAARLALDHVLTRAGFALHTVEPLFVVARSASDVQGAFWMAQLIDDLMGPLPELG